MGSTRTRSRVSHDSVIREMIVLKIRIVTREREITTGSQSAKGAEKGKKMKSITRYGVGATGLITRMCGMYDILCVDL